MCYFTIINNIDTREYFVFFLFIYLFIFIIEYMKGINAHTELYYYYYLSNIIIELFTKNLNAKPTYKSFN